MTATGVTGILPRLFLIHSHESPPASQPGPRASQPSVRCSPPPVPWVPGLLPVALATGVGTDSQRPFALVIVSGLFKRLLISIFLLPALYALVSRPGDRLEV